MVKGKFEFVYGEGDGEGQGTFIEFTHSFDPNGLLDTYNFVHGEICDVPESLASYVNSNSYRFRAGSSEGDIPMIEFIYTKKG